MQTKLIFKVDLQRQLAASLDSRRRSLEPKEVDELRMQLERAEQKASDNSKHHREEVKRTEHITLREDKAESIIREHGKSADIRRRLTTAEATIAEQKTEFVRYRLDLQQHEENAVEYQKRIGAAAKELQRFETAYLQQQRTIESQQEELEQYRAEVQRLETSESELGLSRRS